MPDVNLKNLTHGERLLLDRRRRGLSQASAARRLGVGLRRYRRLEGDEEQFDSIKGTPGTLEARTRAQLRKCLMLAEPITVGERCYIARRRAGVQRQALAWQLGVSRQWLTMMEQDRAPNGVLAAHWGLA